MQEVLHSLLLVAGSWEVMVIKCMGTAWSVWQWHQQSKCVPRGVRATMGGALLQFPLFCQLMKYWGSQVESIHRLLVVAGHSFLWFLRLLLWLYPVLIDLTRVNVLPLAPHCP